MVEKVLFLVPEVPPTLLKSSANERNIKINTKFCFLECNLPYRKVVLLFENTTKIHDEMPQKLQIKYIKDYKSNTSKIINRLQQKLKISLVVSENKSEENTIKTGYIAENIDIYSLFWHKIINFVCVLL